MIVLSIHINEEIISLEFEEDIPENLRSYIADGASRVCYFLISHNLLGIEELNNKAKTLIVKPFLILLKKLSELDCYEELEANENARLMVQEQVDFFVSNIISALLHLKNEKQAACKIAFKNKFINADECQLLEIICLNSDPHYGGKTVIQFNLIHGNKIGKIIHKPSSVMLDFLLLCNMSAIHAYGLAEEIKKNYEIISVLLKKTMPFLCCKVVWQEVSIYL